MFYVYLYIMCIVTPGYPCRGYSSLCVCVCVADLLAIPASSAPIERVFSTSGQITASKCNRLNDKDWKMKF